MKIILLHNAYRLRGGEDVVFDNEFRMLSAANHDVTRVELSNDQIYSFSDKFKTLVNAHNSKEKAKWIETLIENTGAKIIHIHNFFPLLTPSVHVAAARKGVAVVQTLHNFRLICANAMLLRNNKICEKCIGGSRQWGVVYRCYRGSLVGSLAVVAMQNSAARRRIWQNDVHRFIALTEFAREKFVEGGIPGARIAVKPNFINSTASIAPSETRSGALFVGRLSKEKGVDVLLNAWRSFGNVPLTIVGDGPESDRLRRDAPQNVRFVGSLSISSVRELMTHSIALIVPSVWYEGFPMVIVEAFSVGLPVIASDIGSLGELIKEGENGAKFIPKDVDSLRLTLAALFADPGRLARLGKGAKTTFDNLYTEEKNLHILEKIYSEAIELANTQKKTYHDRV